MLRVELVGEAYGGGDDGRVALGAVRFAMLLMMMMMAVLMTMVTKMIFHDGP